MSTAVTTNEEKPTTLIKYVPIGQQDEIVLAISTVRQLLCQKTKNGHLPPDPEVIKFMKMCQARRLNPWTNDAWLLGYDGRDGPEFSLITSIQALLKRAECNAHYEGHQAGVMVRRGTEIESREGTLLFDKEILLAGWARVFRSDRTASYYAEAVLTTYNTGRSRWSKDPAGMIRKCALAASLREGFPTENAGLYSEDEMERSVIVAQDPPRAGMDNLRHRLSIEVPDEVAPTSPEPPATPPPEPQQDPSPPPPEADEDTEPYDTTVDWRDKIKKARSNKKRVEILAEASNVLDEQAMLELQAYAEDLANAKE